MKPTQHLSLHFEPVYYRSANSSLVYQAAKSFEPSERNKRNSIFPPTEY